MGGIYLEVKVAAEYASQTQRGSASRALLIRKSVLFEMGGQHQPSTTLPPRKKPVPTVLQAEGAPEPVYASEEYRNPLGCTGFRTPDRQAYIESLYRLSYSVSPLHRSGVDKHRFTTIKMAAIRFAI